MCGDPKTWFPMRVTYQREMKVKAELDRLGIENFVPMRYKVVESQNGGDTELQRVLVPAISNLIFVRSTQERMSELKRRNEVLEPLGVYDGLYGLPGTRHYDGGGRRDGEFYAGGFAD